ncbi:hypothetical protein ABEV55_16120 [Aneurinibacillus thermoaerophilus]|uniref:hypothetical protein n=1 Tax=Aneurinibacillus thermoaerophilus TaxID=143495 RepID=UPI002E1E05C2|nr:hypothetical protein [Aneurinibacillus thermoaerophilus]
MNKKAVRSQKAAQSPFLHQRVRHMARQQRIAQLHQEREAMNRDFYSMMKRMDENKVSLKANELAFKEDIYRLKNLMEEDAELVRQ